MTAKRRLLIQRSHVLVAGANARLLADRNIAKGDDFDEYDDAYLFYMLDQEVTEAKEKVIELSSLPHDSPLAWKLRSELVLECGDVINDLRFIGLKYGALSPHHCP